MHHKILKFESQVIMRFRDKYYKVAIKNPFYLQLKWLDLKDQMNQEIPDENGITGTVIETENVERNAKNNATEIIL